MEEKTADFFERIRGMIPREALISDIRYEGSDVAVYIKNKKMFAENGAFVREIVSALKKRIILRPDPSICINPEKAEEIIKSLIPMDAGLKEIYFEPEIGTVVLETDKPGLAIGKGGEILREIKKQTFWNVDIKRVPAIPSDVVKTLHELLYKESVFRKDFLDRIGKRIHGGWKGTDWIRFTALGGYREVGRSCTLLQTPESKVLMDCGLKPGTNEYPYLSVPEFGIQSLDAVVLSHSHLDHCGFIPYLYEYGFDGPLYCTAPTRDLMVLLCLDFIEIAQREGKPPLYTSKGVKEAVKHAVTLEYGEVSDVTPDMRLTLVNAGHLLGSAITHVHIGNGMHNVVYTGDLKFDRTALFEPASADFARVETLITESTYGGEGDFQPPRDVAESNLVKSVKKVMERRGKVIIPAFAVERAQDVMVILAENGFEYPVYLDGMLWDASAIYTAYPEYLGIEVQQMIFREGFNPFTSKIFKRVGSAAERKAVIESPDPCVIIATSGMLSVDSEEPVFIRNSGKPKLVKIGEFIDKKIEKAEKKIKFDGCIEGEAVKMEGVDVAALNLKTGKIGFMPATFVMRHKVDKPLYEIVAKSGRRVKVTASHSVLVLEDGKINEKKVEDMKEGDFLIIPKMVDNNSESLGEIDLLRGILDNVPEELQKSIFVRCENVLSFAKNDWQRKNKTVHISSLKNKGFDSECSIGFGCSTDREVKRTLEITPELGKLLGYFAAEGHVTISEKNRTGRIAFSFGPTEMEMAKETAIYLQSCFGMKSDIIEDKEKSCIVVKVDSKLLGFIFKYVMRTGYNAHEKRIPEIIFKADKSVQLKFMEGYLKGDGYIGKKGKRIVLEFSSVSKNMISDLAYLLTLNNVSVSSLREKIRKPAKIRNREVAESKRWVLTITNSSYIKNVQEILPEEIQLMLSEIRDCEGQAPFSLPVKESGFKQILKSVKSKELKNQKWGISSRKRISFERARKIIELLKNENKSLDTSHIEILLSGFLGFDPVKKINKAESSSEYVYDFSVEGHENFLGGFGGVMLHNTGGPAMEYLKQLADSDKNMLLFVGYQAEGTLGRKIQKGWKEIPVSENGRTMSLPIKLEIATIEGLSGHSDRKQLINYIYRLRQKPERIVCCHGEPANCMELAHGLHRIFRCETLAPKLLETVRLR